MLEPCPPHHWLLGDLIPGQAKDMGQCKFCGTTKSFPLVMDNGYEDLRVQRPSYLALAREIVGYMAEQVGREV